MIDGGRNKPTRESPGKTSVGEEKKTAKPRVKKLGLLPGVEKRSRGMRKEVEPMVMWMGEV